MDESVEPVHPPLLISGGRIHYRLYGQDGQFLQMTCADTPSLRKFVEWVRRHDRHTPPVAQLDRAQGSEP